MRIFYFTIFFAMLSLTASSQAIRITVHEKSGERSKPLADTKFEVTLNDTLKTELTSASDGILGKIPLDPGRYKLVLVTPGFESSETKNIIVNDKKLTVVSVTCVPIHKEVDKKKLHGK